MRFCRVAGPFRATNPADVVVALVARTLVVVVHQIFADQVLLDVGWHWIRWSGRHSPMKPQFGSKDNMDLRRSVLTGHTFLRS